MKISIKSAVCLAFGSAALAHAESFFKVSGVSVGNIECAEADARLIIETGNLELVDTVLGSASYISVDKVIPRKELDLNGYIVCGAEEVRLNEVKATRPGSQRSLDLGSNVQVMLDSLYLGSNSRKQLSAVATEMEFKRKREEEGRKRVKSLGNP